MKGFSRKERYIADEGETTVTLENNAALKALKSVNLIELIVLSVALYNIYTVVLLIVTQFHLWRNKIPYIGDKYGYTGTASPLLALYSSLKEGKIKRGDYIEHWSVVTN